jgi:hypothetical protein
VREEKIRRDKRKGMKDIIQGANDLFKSRAVDGIGSPAPLHESGDGGEGVGRWSRSFMVDAYSLEKWI